MRLATFEQAISRTTIAIPETHQTVRASTEGSGPAAGLSPPSNAAGRATVTGAFEGSCSTIAAQLFAIACVRSALARSSETPSFRRTIISIQPQL
jgi:hypothetical protein